MKSRLLLASAAVLLAVGVVLVQQSPSTAVEPKTADKALLKDVQDGGLEISRIGRLSFGPKGILLVTEPSKASVIAIDTGDVGPVKKLKQRVNEVNNLIAAGMGAPKGSVTVLDMAVNPLSGGIYLAVRRKQDQQDAIFTVDADGKIAPLKLKQARYVRVTLPGGEKSTLRNITDVEFAKDRVIAAGQCNEQFASKVYSIPLPLTHGQSAAIFSAETYHVAHRRWETKAPIQSLIPYEEDGKSYVVGSFACTPIAKFPLDGLESGAEVKGTSVVELGSGNRPLDMFTYEKDGRRWLVTNTDRFHHERRPIGPSRYWGCRVAIDYLSSDKTNEDATRRDVKSRKGPDGIEVIEDFFGVTQVDKLNDNEAVVLRDNNGNLDLEVTALP